jgi:hypothetical protein
MAGDTITGTITHTVRLNHGRFGNPLTITATGDVAPQQYGDTAILVPKAVHHAMITNQGHIAGAYGGKNTAAGGIGVDGVAATNLTNSGVITGGDVGYFSTHGGGTGVYLQAGGTITNNGTISAGATGYDHALSGADGITLLGGGSVTNTGVVTGGLAGGGFLRVAGTGGAGVNLQNASLNNSGAITGGQGGSSNEYAGGTGGVGASLAGAVTLVNSGQIVGGSGAAYTYANGGAGGNGVVLGAGAMLDNSGLIAGGQGDAYSKNYGGVGGTGVALNGAGASNMGTILGGRGGSGRYGASAGGVGVALTGGSLVNGGMIAGGTGGRGGNGHYKGGAGGTGVVLNGGTLTSTGTIAGGAGYAEGASGGGAGGIGILFEGGTLIVSGSVAGGVNANGKAGTADAILMNAPGTLTLDPGAAFIGVVVADAPAVLDLAGAGGTLSGLGTAFTGFDSVTEDAQATWKLTGANMLGAGTQVLESGVLSVTGTLADAGSATVSGTGELLAADGGFLHVADMTLAGGTIATDATSSVAIGGGTTHPPAGILKVEAGFSLNGNGHVGSAATSGIVDNGMIASQGGTLTLDTSVSGTGALTIGSGSAMSLVGNVSTASLTFASGGSETLLVSAASTISTALSGFGVGDVIDVAKAANSLTFADGTLTLLHQGMSVEVLILSGSYTQDSFALSKDGHGGTDVTYGGSHADAIDGARLPVLSAFEEHGYGMWHGIEPLFDR